MKKVTLSGNGIITGSDALDYLKNIKYKRAFLVTGGSSMKKFGFLDEVCNLLKEADCDVKIYAGIQMNPCIDEVLSGLATMREYSPDVVIGLGGGSALDAAKAMLLFYEFPELNFENVLEKNLKGEIPAIRKTGLICIPSTSGTGSEVTRGTVITDPVRELKIPIMTDCLRPDIAILDPRFPMTMPPKIVAETGLDALTHAIEAYTNHNLDDINEGLCRSAIEGIMTWLPISYQENTVESREKVHHYQAMAGIGFANVGLGMVHGIAHSFGAIFNMAHGLTNAIILPYALEFNQKDPVVAQKLEKLSYTCKCDNIITEIKQLREMLQIPTCFLAAGITEADFQAKYELLVSHSMLGATKVNPVPITEETMRELVKLVYYGN